MPSLMLRALPADLVARVKAYARAKELPLPAAAAQLLTIALDHLDARSAGAVAVNQQRTPEERSAAASKAVQARWEKAKSSSAAD